MTVITLTGHMGATGAIGVLLAQRLGYRLVDHELITRAAEIVGCSEHEAQDFDERTGGFVQRLVDFFERQGMQGALAAEPWTAFQMGYVDASQQPLTAGEQYIEALRTTILRLADEGNVVIVGRGAQAILAQRPDTVHIRLACDVEERARRVARRSNVTMEEAAREVAESDRGREEWHRRFFGIDYRSPYLYTLVVNTGMLDDMYAASLIADVAQRTEQDTSVLPTMRGGSPDSPPCEHQTVRRAPSGAELRGESGYWCDQCGAPFAPFELRPEVIAAPI